MDWSWKCISHHSWVNKKLAYALAIRDLTLYPSSSRYWPLYESLNMESQTEKQDNCDQSQPTLDDDEIELLDSQVHLPGSNTGYMAIFRYAQPVDLVVMLMSAVAAAGAGATAPLMTVRDII